MTIDILTDYIPRSELRARLGVSDPTLGCRIRQYKLIAYRFGGWRETLYRRDAVHDLLAETRAPKSEREPKLKRKRSSRPRKRFQRRVHYDTYEGVIDGYEVVDTERDEVLGFYTSSRHASHLVKKWNEKKDRNT